MSQIWQCADGYSGAVSLDGGATMVPTCAESQGMWVEESPPWILSTIPASDVADLISAQILFVAVVWVAVAVGRSINPGE